MSKFNYNKSLNTANRLLSKFGGDVFLEEPDTTLHKSYGVFSNLESKDRPANLTEENLLEFWMSAEIEDDYVPQLGDYLLSGSEVHIIVQIDPVKPNPVGFTLLRRLIVKL